MKPTNYDCNEVNREVFWEIIAEAYQRKDSVDINALGDAIMEVLEEKCSDKALVSFHLLVEDLRNNLPRGTYEIAKEILPYDSIEGAPFHRFKNWVIALGKEHYENAAKDLKYLLDIKDPDLFVVGQALFEDLDYVASAVYYEREEKYPSLPDWNDLLNAERKAKQLSELLGDPDRGMELD
jgi:hypothetical protein